MEMVPITGSSQINEVGYDPQTQILQVRFRGGQLYRYTDVPEEIYSGLMGSPSRGQYFASTIRDAFAYQRVE